MHAGAAAAAQREAVLQPPDPVVAGMDAGERRRWQIYEENLWAIPYGEVSNPKPQSWTLKALKKGNYYGKVYQKEMPKLIPSFYSRGEGRTTRLIPLCWWQLLRIRLMVYCSVLTESKIIAIIVNHII